MSAHGVTKARFEREVGALREKMSAQDSKDADAAKELALAREQATKAEAARDAALRRNQEALDEIQGYKSKRLAAKSEMIAIVRALETEREATAKRDAWVRETLLPKVLGHTVILQDTIATLDGVTQRLGGAGTAAGGGMTAV